MGLSRQVDDGSFTHTDIKVCASSCWVSWRQLANEPSCCSRALYMVIYTLIAAKCRTMDDVQHLHASSSSIQHVLYATKRLISVTEVSRSPLVSSLMPLRGFGRKRGSIRFNYTTLLVSLYLTHWHCSHLKNSCCSILYIFSGSVNNSLPHMHLPGRLSR